MKIIDYADREMMAIEVAHRLASALSGFLAGGEMVTFAAAGGETPGPIYDDLCATGLDWGRVRIMPTDERLVPADHPRSNEAMLRARLLQGNAAAARFIALRPGADGMAGLQKRVSRALPVSLLLLGMGADMHTASLFPGAEGLAAALAPDAAPVARLAPADAPEERLSLTAPVLSGALAVHIVITGEKKRRALERAVALDDPAEAPISLMAKDAHVHWAA